MVADILLLLFGLALVIIGADKLVEGASSIARKAGLSEFLIGMTVVGIGTSLPEFVVSFAGALRHSADIAIGNVAGSNIFNVFLILGVTALIRPVSISQDNKKKDIPVNILVTLLLVCAGLQHTLFGIGRSDTINAIEGAVFLLLFTVYLIISIRTGKAPEEETHKDFMAEVDATLVRIRQGQTVTGKVVQITDDVIDRKPFRDRQPFRIIPAGPDARIDPAPDIARQRIPDDEDLRRTRRADHGKHFFKNTYPTDLIFLIQP